MFMKKVLIFGSEGQLGNDLVQALYADYEVKAYNRALLDITNFRLLSSTIESEKPDIVINATAYNKVELAESESELADKINGQAVGIMAKACAKINSIFVHVSSDYI